jgi:ribosomal protein S12
VNRKRPLRKPGLKYKNPTFSRTPILKRCPQAKGIVTRLATMSPKKT